VATVTRATIRGNARLFADQRPDGTNEAITDAEANGLVNLRVAELWDRLIALRGGEAFEAVNTALPTVANTATITLPTDFYQLLAFDLAWSATRLEPVGQLPSIADRYRYADIPWAEGEAKAFRQRGSGNSSFLEIFPTPTTAVNTAIRYITAFTPLATNNSADSTALETFNGWDRAVSLGVAADMRVISGLDSADVLRLYMADLERIDTLITERSASHPQRIRDVYPEGSLVTDDWMRLRTPAS
jgi:hypothetical protein